MGDTSSRHLWWLYCYFRNSVICFVRPFIQLGLYHWNFIGRHNTLKTYHKPRTNIWSDAFRYRRKSCHNILNRELEWCWLSFGYSSKFRFVQFEWISILRYRLDWCSSWYLFVLSYSSSSMYWRYLHSSNNSWRPLLKHCHFGNTCWKLRHNCRSGCHGPSTSSLRYSKCCRSPLLWWIHFRRNYILGDLTKSQR